MSCPKAYLVIVNQLADMVCYSPGSIARLAEELGLIGGDAATLYRKRRKIRHTLARYAVNHNFPVKGHGLVTLEGQGPTPGWFGWFWKDTYGRRDPS